MKKSILLFILTVQTFCIIAQLTGSEKQSIDSLLKSGKINSAQIIQIERKLNSPNSTEFKVNKISGEITISDILSFPNVVKKIIFQRCLEWIAINYGDLIYNDLESGKIIANGQIDITHYTGIPSGSSMRINQIQTPVNYTMILTVKDNKIKYTITNIVYNFKNFSETIDEINYPISSIYSGKDLNVDWQRNWVRFLTALNSSSDTFYFTLKNTLINYINDREDDYKF
jgi:hypothetical protein